MSPSPRLPRTPIKTNVFLKIIPLNLETKYGALFHVPSRPSKLWTRFFLHIGPFRPYVRDRRKLHTSILFTPRNVLIVSTRRVWFSYKATRIFSSLYFGPRMAQVRGRLLHTFCHFPQPSTATYQDQCLFLNYPTENRNDVRSPFSCSKSTLNTMDTIFSSHRDF